MSVAFLIRDSYVPSSKEDFLGADPMNKIVASL